MTVLTVLGVLGGMGPAAGAEFFRRFTDRWPGASDQEHPRVVLLSEPRVPDRTAALASGSSGPEAPIRSSLEFLVSSGVGLIAVPCNTAFVFIDRFRHRIPVPIIDIVGVAVSAAQRARPDGSWLLATSGTVRAGLYQRHAARAGYPLRIPGPRLQATVDEVIHAVKGGDLGRARGLVRRIGERPVLLGCTELSLAWEMDGSVTDSLGVLADECVRRLSHADPGEERETWHSATR